MSKISKQNLLAIIQVKQNKNGLSTLKNISLKSKKENRFSSKIPQHKASIPLDQTVQRDTAKEIASMLELG